jgi:hypothetical protein
MVRLVGCTVCVVALTAAGPQADAPRVQAEVLQGPPSSVHLTVVNSTTGPIVLISPGTPSFILDPKTCVATISSVVTNDAPDFAFTPTLTQVDAGGTWSGVATPPRGFLKHRGCKRWSMQVKLAFIPGAVASGTKPSQAEVIERQQVMTSEVFQFATRSNYCMQRTAGRLAGVTSSAALAGRR